MRTLQARPASAFRPFEEQGYDDTAVEQIAEGAEVFPSTGVNVVVLQRGPPGL
ncbi:hypothetical protein [Streptomyces sp. NPDC002676]